MLEIEKRRPGRRLTKYRPAPIATRKAQRKHPTASAEKSLTIRRSVTAAQPAHKRIGPGERRLLVEQR